VDCDDQGRGGDDMYDETRYALASRPVRGEGAFNTFRGAWSPEALKAERDRNQTVPAEEDEWPVGLTHEEFGDLF
jgi:hypothetical protein